MKVALLNICMHTMIRKDRAGVDLYVPPHAYITWMIDGVVLVTWQTCDHHTHIARRCAAETIRAVDEKDKSFDTQRMLAHVVRATQTTVLRPRATENAFANLHHTHHYRTSNLYRRPVSSRLERSAPSTVVFTQRMLHQEIVQANDAWTLSETQIAILLRMRQGQTKAVTCYL